MKKTIWQKNLPKEDEKMCANCGCERQLITRNGKWKYSGQGYFCSSSCAVKFANRIAENLNKLFDKFGI